MRSASALHKSVCDNRSEQGGCSTAGASPSNHGYPRVRSRWIACRRGARLWRAAPVPRRGRYHARTRYRVGRDSPRDDRVLHDPQQRWDARRRHWRRPRHPLARSDRPCRRRATPARGGWLSRSRCRDPRRGRVVRRCEPALGCAVRSVPQPRRRDIHPYRRPGPAARCLDDCRACGDSRTGDDGAVCGCPKPSRSGCPRCVGRRRRRRRPCGSKDRCSVDTAGCSGRPRRIRRTAKARAESGTQCFLAIRREFEPNQCRSLLGIRSTSWRRIDLRDHGAHAGRSARRGPPLDTRGCRLCSGEPAGDIRRLPSVCGVEAARTSLQRTARPRRQPRGRSPLSHCDVVGNGCCLAPLHHMRDLCGTGDDGFRLRLFSR